MVRKGGLWFPTGGGGPIPPSFYPLTTAVRKAVNAYGGQSYAVNPAAIVLRLGHTAPQVYRLHYSWANVSTNGGTIGMRNTASPFDDWLGPLYGSQLSVAGGAGSAFVDMSVLVTGSVADCDPITFYFATSASDGGGGNNDRNGDFSLDGVVWISGPCGA
jgi:hypothetical protein